MTGFDIAVGTIPGNINEFHGPGSLLVIRHPSAPWTSAPSLEGASKCSARTHRDGRRDDESTCGRTAPSKSARHRVLLSRLESLGEGDGVTDFANSAFYIFPKHRHQG